MQMTISKWVYLPCQASTQTAKLNMIQEQKLQNSKYSHLKNIPCLFVTNYWYILNGTDACKTAQSRFHHLHSPAYIWHTWAQWKVTWAILWLSCFKHVPGKGLVGSRKHDTYMMLSKTWPVHLRITTSFLSTLRFIDDWWQGCNSLCRKTPTFCSHNITQCNQLL